MREIHRELARGSLSCHFRPVSCPNGVSGMKQRGWGVEGDRAGPRRRSAKANLASITDERREPDFLSCVRTSGELSHS